jgi:Nucleotidyl transferase AbiEii toxin, Type IV TA system
MLDGLNRDGDTHLAFKGGASMEFRFGATARASRDVDALADLDFDEAFAEIGRRLRAGWEGFTGTLTERTEITRAGIVPAPQRCKIKLAYQARPFATLAFELGRAEANSFELLEEVANATNMDKVQLGPNSDIVVLSVHYQIAQKLHACTEIPIEGTNPRVHDLYDILLLSSLAENAGLARTRAACEDTFTHRNKHAWPPALPDWDEWEFLWDSIDVPNDIRYPYRDARDRVAQLIRAIASA